MNYSVSAPGRICLFGEHQDYLGLPVIAAAISLDLTLEVTLEQEAMARYRIVMPDINDEETIDLREPLVYRHKKDYLRSALAVLRREGVDLPKALTAVVRSKIPIAAGTSSSSALSVAWIAALLYGARSSQARDPDRIARLAHACEVIEFKEQGGMMDQISIAHGHVCLIDFSRTPPAAPLACRPQGFVLGDSCQPKDTQRILGRVRRAAEGALAKIRKALPSFDLRTSPLEEAREAASRLLDGEEKRVFLGNLKNRALLQEASALLSNEEADPRNLGRLLYEHHRALRDDLEISTPRIEAMMDAALKAGALGGKINGSGGGGCLFVLAPGCREAVVRAMEQAGGRAFPLDVGPGVQIR